VPAETTLTYLVDEFVATMDRHDIVVDRHSIEQEMCERIAAIADRLHIDPRTVLREHARQGWGRQMATAVIAQIREQNLLVRDAPPRDSAAGGTRLPVIGALFRMVRHRFRRTSAAGLRP
jgi:hypothetical protein